MDRKKRASEYLPPMELAIMHVLWDNGPLSVQDVQARLEGEPAYTTVQTILNTMEKKGRAKRKLRGKAYIYRAAILRDVALSHAVRDLVQRTFQGSVEGLLMNLVKNEQIDEGTLRRLNHLIQEKEVNK